MKKIILFLTLIFAISCAEKAPIDYALLSGKILNKTGGEITISNDDNSLKKVIKIAEDGTFKDTLRFEKGFLFFDDGINSAQIYIENGNDILMNFDTNNFKNTLTFEGKGSEISSYLFLKETKIAELTGDDRKLFYALDENAYKTKLQEIKTAIENLLNTTNGISEEFKSKELKNINYEYLFKLNIYETYHAHYAELPDFKVSEGYLAELSDFNYEIEEDFLFSNFYERMVSANYWKQAAELSKLDSTPEDIAYLKMVNKSTSAVIKNKLLFDAAKYDITYTNDFEAYYKEYMLGSTNEKNNAEITESYNKLKTVAKGNVSPKFVDYENYAGGTTSLDDLKGKFVYIDVWATWCGPCKAEIPFLKELEAKYHGKNIEFVSISVDALKDYDKWKAMVSEKELKGIQLFANNSWKSQFVEDYLIKGIPRFILIDTEGNIINANAPRPSEDKLIALFNELKI
jgi:thiol-disulfide isomerase/thioredoxin